MTADTPVAAQQPTEPQEVQSPAEASHIPRWGVWLAADVSKSAAWALYRERARRFASLIGDRAIALSTASARPHKRLTSIISGEPLPPWLINRVLRPFDDVAQWREGDEGSRGRRFTGGEET